MGQLAVKSSAADHATAWRHVIELPRLQMQFLPATGTTLSGIGTTWSGSGTISTPALGSGSVWEGTARTRATTTAAAGQSASIRSALKLLPGAFSALPGFCARFLFGFQFQAAGHRCFIGLQGSAAAIGNVEPDTLTSAIGIAARSTETILQLMSRRAGTTDWVDLGTSFQVGSLANVPLELDLAHDAASATFEWRMTRLDTGATSSGTVTSANSPGVSTQLAAHARANTGALATPAAAIEVAGVIATDY